MAGVRVKMPTIKLLGLANGHSSPFDGQYVLDYDPAREGTDPNGDPMFAHLVTTPDREKALNLSTEEAFALWKKAHGMRPDGRENRPLTAFTVEIG